jgi:acyl carrier protein
MTREELSTRIIGAIQEHLTRFSRAGAGEVSEATKLVGGPLDSLDMIEVSFAIEDEFDVELKDEELADLDTVGDFIGHLAGVLGLAEAAA